MNTMSQQRGMGLVEVLVAILVLAIGVLGFVALQYRAVEATAESVYRVQAVNLARDLAERIRVNRGAFAAYATQLQTAANQPASTKNCFTSTSCNANEMADFDVAQVTTRATSTAMTMNLLDCQGNLNARQCVYVAWGDTSATDGTGVVDCTNSTSYNPASTCIIMEVY